MQFSSHLEKYNRSQCIGIEKEHKRNYADWSQYANDVNPERSYLNYYDNRDESWADSYKPLLQQQQELTGKKPRKDTVVVCSIVQTVPASWGDDQAKEYFQGWQSFMHNFIDGYGVDHQQAYLSFEIHLDETQPHATYCFMPFKDGKFQAKNICQKKFLRELQSEGYEWYKKQWLPSHPELEVIEPYTPNSEKKHLNDRDYKAKQDMIADLDAQIAEKRSEMAEMNQNMLTQAQEYLQNAPKIDFKPHSSVFGKQSYILTPDAKETLENALKQATVGITAVAKRESELDWRETKLDQREQELSKWESRLQSWEQSLQEIEDKFKKQIANLKEQLQDLREVADKFVRYLGNGIAEKLAGGRFTNEIDPYPDEPSGDMLRDFQDYKTLPKSYYSYSVNVRTTVYGEYFDVQYEDQADNTHVVTTFTDKDDAIRECRKLSYMDYIDFGNPDVEYDFQGYQKELSDSVNKQLKELNDKTIEIDNDNYIGW